MSKRSYVVLLIMSSLVLFSSRAWSLDEKMFKEMKVRLNKIEESLRNKKTFSKDSFNTKSEMRLRYQHRTNTPSPNRNDLSNFYDMRVRVQLEYSKSRDLRFVFTPQMSKNFGDGTPNDSNRNEGEFSGNKLADMGILETYLDYQVLNNLKIKIGRQSFKYGDGLILNNPKFNNVGRVFDAIKGSITHRWGKTDLFFSRVNDGESDSTLAGGRTKDDTDFLGWYNNLKIFNIDELDIYLLGHLDRGTSTNEYGKLSGQSQEVYSFGLRLKEKLNRWSILTELIWQKGSNQPSKKSNLALLEIGYRVNKKWGLFLEVFYIQEDYRPFYTSRHKYLGHLDIFGIRNMNSLRLRGKYKLSEKTKLMLDLHKFSRNSDKKDVYNLTINNTVGSKTGLDGEGDLGSEIDFKFDTKLKEELGLTSGYAYYIPGNYFKKQNLDIDAHYVYTELNYHF